MYTRVFARSLRIWMRDLPSFVLVMSVMFLAFLQTGLLLFGSSIGRYSSFWRAFSFQLEITLGKVKARPIKELVNANPIFGHLFVVALLFGITIIMMNFFISTLNDALTEAKTLEVEKETEEMSKMKLSTSKPERVNSTKENHDDENTAKKTHNTGKQGGKAPKGKNRAAHKSSRESNVLFDHVSTQVKANDVKLNLPALHILEKKMDEVLKRIDDACSDDINTGGPSKVLQTGKKEKRVQFAGVITVQATVHRDPMPQQEKH